MLETLACLKIFTWNFLSSCSAFAATASVFSCSNLQMIVINIYFCSLFIVYIFCQCFLTLNPAENLRLFSLGRLTQVHVGPECIYGTLRHWDRAESRSCLLCVKIYICWYIPTTSCEIKRCGEQQMAMMTTETTRTMMQIMKIQQ